jgi:AraC family transcriptional regulator
MPAPAPRTLRRTFLEGPLVRISDLTVRPANDAIGPVEREESFLLVLPTSGVFALHDRPQHRRVVTANHAVLVPADAPYRISFPAAIGDHALTLRLSAEALEAVLPGRHARRGIERSLLGFRMLLPPSVMLARNMFWRRLALHEADALGAEEFCMRLFDIVLRASDADCARRRGSVRGAARQRQIERVKEAVAVSPERKWSLHLLAELACTSPYHLARVFRESTGTSIHQYLLRLRLGLALRRLLASEADLATIASDLGFSSHSHFSARFRALFGTTPTEIRRSLGGDLGGLHALLA